MKPVYLKEKKQVKTSAYGHPQPGYLAIESDYSLTWDKCREQFASRFTDLQAGCYFCHPLYEGYKVAAFLTKTEEIIGFADYLHSYAPSAYCETDKDDILWINVSRFWMAQEMRRQLFTIILRAGMNYDPSRDNYEEALWAKDKMGNSYAAETQNAVMRFLYGFTNYSATDVLPTHRGGWVTIFKDRDEQSVRRMLTLPEGERAVSCLIGLGKLWA